MPMYCEEEFEWESDGEFEEVVVDSGSILSREIFRVALIVYCVIGFFVSLILVAYFANMDDDTPSEDVSYDGPYAGI